MPATDRKDSQGICFIGKVDLPVFLQQRLAPRTGDVVEIFKDGTKKIIGKHNGVHYYTIGQRKGLHIGGHINPLFVLETDSSTNTLYVGEGQDHPGLYHQSLFIADEDVHWIRPELRMAKEKTHLPGTYPLQQPLQEAELMYDNGMAIQFTHASSEV